MDDPPPLERIVEGMLFIGGPPLTYARASEAVRGLSMDQFLQAIASLNQTYRSQNRPYTIGPRDGGHEMALRPDFRVVRERLIGGPRETHLSQAALETLSLVAYRQPVTRDEVEALRGADSLSLLRQLVRLGLIALSRGEETTYSTTSRFLQEFGLSSLDDLPRGDEMATM
ncbi:MAG: SMC-Scp complex subunit ScpB [Planctomycetia bacterium]|nr:SMC-Scp complex subunit ScpB [Planctomycetia bacterium]